VRGSRSPFLNDTRKLAFLLIALLASAIAVIVVTSLWAKELAEDEERLNSSKYVRDSIENYGDLYRSLPHNTRDADGKFVTSWRVDLMPFLFAMKHDWDAEQPWTAPINSFWRDSVHPYYCGETTKACVFAFVKEITSDGSGQSRRLGDLPPETLLLVKTPRDSDIHWMEPRDLTLDEALSPALCPPGGFVFVTFADGQVWKLNAECKNDLQRFIDPAFGLPKDERQRVLSPFGRWMNEPRT
jgi:hypothetical protein